MKDTTTKKRLFFITALPAVITLGMLSTMPVRAADEPVAEVETEQPFIAWSDFPSKLDAIIIGKVDRKDGSVDYLILKGDKQLDKFIEAVGAADISKFPTWKIKDKNGKETVDRSVELVFWINAFNAHVLKTVADAYPIESPFDIKDYATAKTHKVAGTNYSLSELRDKIAKMDPRTVFAMIDGTRGGPLLAPVAYRYADIDALLDATVSAYVNFEGNVQLDRPHNVVTLTGFFTQSEPYFKPKSGRRKWEGIREVLSTYTERKADKNYFITSEYQINFRASDTRVNNKSMSGIRENG